MRQHFMQIPDLVLVVVTDNLQRFFFVFSKLDSEQMVLSIRVGS